MKKNVFIALTTLLIVTVSNAQTPDENLAKWESRFPLLQNPLPTT